MQYQFFRRLFHFRVFTSVVIFAALTCSTAMASANLADLKKPRHFAVIRHTRAPGTGDPVGFELGNCKTQRNLSADGIAQAKRLGEQLQHAIGRDFFVYTSEWCRCVDTARLLRGRNPQPLKALNSFFQEPSSDEAQTRNLKRWLDANLQKRHPLVLVTHQVNITALTDVFPAEGEVIVLKMENDKIEIVGRN